MKELATLWLGSGVDSLAVRYVLIAALWLAALLINWKKQSCIAWVVVCLWGIAAMVLAASTIWVVHLPGHGGLFSGIVLFVGICAEATFACLMVCTVVFMCMRKCSPKRN